MGATITRQDILDLMNGRGSIKRTEAELIGEAYPLVSGWRERAVGRPMTRELREHIDSLKGCRSCSDEPLTDRIPDIPDFGRELRTAYRRLEDMEYNPTRKRVLRTLLDDFNDEQ